jgi:hypothetical protein
MRLNRYAICLLIAVGILLSSSALGWETGSLGIGIVVGDPTGLSGKYWLSPHAAVDAAIAWAFGGYFHLHSTYLHHFGKLIPEPEWAAYTGIGGRLKLKQCGDGTGCSRFGVRMSGGIEFSYPPFEAFFEIAPVFELAPKTTLEFEGGVGARFFFRPIWK